MVSFLRNKYGKAAAFPLQPTTLRDFLRSILDPLPMNPKPKTRNHEPETTNQEPFPFTPSKNTPNIPAIHRLLKQEYNTRSAPIVGFQKIRGKEPFRVLIGAILSSRTRDETTGPVTKNLFTKIKKPSDLKRYSTKQIAKMIYPVGFYRTKAKHLKQLPEALDKFNGRVPDTLEALCSLPGVGRKVANLILAEVFNKDAICVDIHVHRISNRLGLVKTKTPEQTEKALKKVLPRKYWKTWNPVLVSHGQTVCTPQRPDCPNCAVEKHCGKINVTTT